MENKEWYTLSELTKSGLLDEIFFNKGITYGSKYEHIRLLTKRKQLKSKKFTGNKYDWVKVRREWVDEYLANLRK